MPVTEIKVELLHEPVRHKMFFNQFGIHRTSDVIELHFAFGRSASDLLGGVIVIVTDEALERQRISFLKYLKEIELPNGDAVTHVRVRDQAAIIYADFIGLSRHGTIAEITFHAVNWKAAIDLPKQSKKDPAVKAKAECEAVLRSSLDMHRNWISLLYES